MSTSQDSTQTTAHARPAMAAFGGRIARSLRVSRRRVLSIAVAALMAGGVAVAAQPAFADGSGNLCYHDFAGTLIEANLTLITTPGIVVDTYLQRWNGSAWAYVAAGYYSNGQPNYLFQRASSTTAGWWMTSDGHYVNDMSIQLRNGTGTYRLVAHLYVPSNGVDRGYQWIAYYQDNLRGQTDWCTS